MTDGPTTTTEIIIAARRRRVAAESVKIIKLLEFCVENERALPLLLLADGR